MAYSRRLTEQYSPAPAPKAGGSAAAPPPLSAPLPPLSPAAQEGAAAPPKEQEEQEAAAAAAAGAAGTAEAEAPSASAAERGEAAATAPAARPLPEPLALADSAEAAVDAAAEARTLALAQAALHGTLELRPGRPAAGSTVPSAASPTALASSWDRVDAEKERQRRQSMATISIIEARRRERQLLASGVGLAGLMRGGSTLSAWDAPAQLSPGSSSSSSWRSVQYTLNPLLPQAQRVPASAAPALSSAAVDAYLGLGSPRGK
jgi:hypothetical protein